MQTCLFDVAALLTNVTKVLGGCWRRGVIRAVYAKVAGDVGFEAVQVTSVR